MALEPSEVERIFREAGALLDGHFVLASGRHSSRYLEKFRVFTQPRLTERLSAAIAERARSRRVDVVAGPTTGGMLLAQEVARQLGTPALYAERDDGRRAFRRGQTVPRGARVLVVDDVLTTGGSVRETVDAVRSAGGEVMGVSVLADRSGGTDLGVPLEALWRGVMDSFPPEACPLCRAGVPATKPGTTPAREVTSA